MRGKIGTPMVVEHAPSKKGHHCNKCAWLEYSGRDPETPYRCTLKGKDRHWTSICVCKEFAKELSEKDKDEKRTAWFVKSKDYRSLLNKKQKNWAGFKFINYDNNTIWFVWLPLSAFAHSKTKQMEYAGQLNQAEKKMMGDVDNNEHFLSLEDYLSWTAPDKVIQTRVREVVRITKDKNHSYNIIILVKRVQKGKKF